jgi:tetratricopeptide (TPR) repeat protein
MINKYTGNQMNINLYIMKCKLYYSLHEIKNCESAAKEIINLDESNIDGHYLLACCYTSKQQYESAFKQLSILFSVNGSAQIENVIRLNGFLCTKINPPQYDEAVLSFDLLVSKYPEDMNAVILMFMHIYINIHIYPYKYTHINTNLFMVACIYITTQNP